MAYGILFQNLIILLYSPLESLSTVAKHEGKSVQ